VQILYTQMDCLSNAALLFIYLYGILDFLINLT
jgi:hypothetical protein